MSQSPEMKSLDRRALLQLAAIGTAALVTGPLHAASKSEAALFGTGFTHGVASGEPGPDRILLWTRFVGSADQERLGYELSESAAFTRIVARGALLARPDSDWCAKTVATGLEPARWYYYRFIGPGGEVSVTGRTRTLPVGHAARFRMAVFSCSNIGFGYFNAYAHAAASGEFDLAVHLGDFTYEYQRGEYPKASQTAPGRLVEPHNETVTLADYRLRQAAYHADPDLRALLQACPMVLMWDDHETANDSWKGGAENHQPDREGDWGKRRTAAIRAYREWLPVSDADYASYEIGDLATLWRLESRLAARTLQLDLKGLAAKAAPGQMEAALATFRDGAWQDPARALLGERQEAWLGRTLKASVGQGKVWQVIAQQVVMGRLAMPDPVLAGMSADKPAYLKDRLAAYTAAAHVGLPYSMDAWDGYPAARDRLLGAAQAADANLIVLSGDSHNAWAFNLDRGERKDAAGPVGVEFGVTSVTSPGSEGTIDWMKPADLARATIARNPQLKWCDMAGRGYSAVELTAALARCEYRFTAPVTMRSARLTGIHRVAVLPGRKRLAVT